MELLLILLILLVTLIMITLVYIFTGSVKSVPPKKLSKEYDLKEYKFQNRTVFKIEPKEGSKTSKVILYIHGGSYVSELYMEHWKFFKDLLQDTGCKLIVPDYPLTPKYKYTDVFGMMLPLYRDIIKKIDKENLIVMGDSAGGGIALALMEEAGKEKLIQPSKLILISPWLDVSMENPQIDKVQEKDKMLNKKLLEAAGIAYAGEQGMDKYLVNPINGSLKKLENVTIFTGTYDILNPDVHKLEQIAKEQQINIEVKETKKAGHIWIIKRYTDKRYDDEKAEIAYNELINLINKK